MAKSYRERLQDTLNSFTAKGDVLECVSIERSADVHNCELCGHSPIFWLHRLKNLRTERILVAGSSCISNFRKVYLAMYDEPLLIQAQEHLRGAIEKVNKQSPSTITVITSQVCSDWQDFDDYDHADEDLDEDLDDIEPDEGAAEGLGSDEIDWDNPGVVPSHGPGDELNQIWQDD